LAHLIENGWGVKNAPSVQIILNDQFVTHQPTRVEASREEKNTCLIGVLRESGLERSVEQYLGLMELARQCSRGHIHGSDKPYIKKAF
jgi:hypothetical protein